MVASGELSRVVKDAGRALLAVDVGNTNTVLGLFEDGTSSPATGG